MYDADISMEVERDFDNEYDEFAMKVSMPNATKVKAGLLDAITRPEKQWYRVCGIPRLAVFPDYGHFDAKFGKIDVCITPYL